MKKLILFTSCISLLMVFACSAESKNPKEDNSSAKNESQKMEVPDSPCEIVSSEDIRAIIGVESSFEIAMKDKDYTYPTCTFEWEDKKVTKSMEIGGKPMEIEMPSEVMIVLVKDANEEKFNRSTQVYKDGVEVNGVGEIAMWGNGMAQLTFLKGSVMIHVHVKVDNDDAINKEKAIDIAKLILEKI